MGSHCVGELLVRQPENLFKDAQVVIRASLPRNWKLRRDTPLWPDVFTVVWLAVLPRVIPPASSDPWRFAHHGIESVWAWQSLPPLRSRRTGLNGPAVIAGELRTMCSFRSLRGIRNLLSSSIRNRPFRGFTYQLSLAWSLEMWFLRSVGADHSANAGSRISNS